MNDKYYSGHCFSWTKKFIDVIITYNKNKKCLRPYKANCIACAIQHRYTIEKKREITLDHKTLHIFGINRKGLKKYLELFAQANLIKLTYKKGAAPKIFLTSLPTNYVKYNKMESKKNNRIIDKRNMSQAGQVTCSKQDKSLVPSRTGYLSQTGHVQKSKNEAKEARHRKKQDKIGKQGRYTKEKGKGGK